MGPETVLSVRGLVKQFVLHNIGGEVVSALNGVDLDVAAGEHVALAGSSGAGKSTLLKCVFRTYLADGGTIALACSDGRRIDMATATDREVLDARRREVGYVSQFLRAAPRRSVLDVVTGAARGGGLDAAAARDAAARSLQRLHIAEALWGHHAAVLSGGERQRVNLAAGTIIAPTLLLLDEPVSALDPANRDAVLDAIAELKDRGVALLSVFHDLDAMHRLADRVAVLERGRITREGPPSDIVANTLLREVAR